MNKHLLIGLISVGLLSIVGTAQATLETQVLGSDAEAGALIGTEGTSFVAEGRIGDRSGRATFELDLGANTSQPQNQTQFGWQNGSAECFSLTYQADADLVTFLLGGNTLTYQPQGLQEQLLLRTRATKVGSMMTLDNLYLNGMSVGASSIADGDGSGIQILSVSGIDFSQDWILSGHATMVWNEVLPKNSHLAFQISAASMAPPPVPEPATVFLLTLGGFVGLRRRR